jgi:hypothetical protein
MSNALPQLTLYPVELEPFVILRNSSFRKRFIVSQDGVEIDLTQQGLSIDADIKDSSGQVIGWFTPALREQDEVAIPGMFDLELTPQQTLALPVAKSHQTDISITMPNGDRFYYAKAPVEVRETVSRNDQ